MFDKLIDEKLLPFIFTQPKHPMRFNELMRANKLFVDNMPLEGQIPGVKLRLGRAYLFMIVVWNLVLIPLALIFHKILAKIDCHVAIILAVVFTLLFFGILSIFKQWAAEKMAEKMIRQAWKIHFPYYDYETYHAKVAKFYDDAVERGVTGANLEMYIMNALSLEK
ncbi:hypothetical protein [Hydrogenimonas cancrithermarum]|uniref:Uncharacterized protein n=1 Tax=Hydrogenimonas cancrithermarum TaxID=2993563 RepID=A0ABN6WYM7_9BACT|nr:hypothetical protein [Hydrogenimonas cancrithermarum]BDY13350.1 hypothetical protein HCR_16620 [Hydrogenimonas cancrithermarum]